MRTLPEYLRLYFIIEAQYIKARMQYRADFIISSVGMFFSSLATLGIFWVILESVPDLAGWSLMEMTFIYAFSKRTSRRFCRENLVVCANLRDGFN